MNKYETALNNIVVQLCKSDIYSANKRWKDIRALEELVSKEHDVLLLKVNKIDEYGRAYKCPRCGQILNCYSYDNRIDGYCQGCGQKISNHR